MTHISDNCYGVWIVFYEQNDDLMMSPWCEYSNFKHDVEKHFHHHIEIIYVTAGCLRVDTGRAVNEINAGNFIYIGCGIPHATYTDGNCCYYLYGTPKIFVMPAIIPKIEAMSGAFIGTDATGGVYELMRLICENSDRHNAPSDIISQTLAITLSNAILSLIIPQADYVNRSPKSDGQLTDVLMYIYDNYKDPRINTKTLAAKFGYTERMLSERFNAELKMGVHRFINNLRINEAKFQLLTTSDNVDVIAERVGFESLGSFFRVFSRICGCTPTEYRSNKE